MENAVPPSAGGSGRAAQSARKGWWMLIARYTGEGGGPTLHKSNPNSPHHAFQQPAVFSQMDQ